MNRRLNMRFKLWLLFVDWNKRLCHDGKVMARQVILEDHVLLLCPHCWKREEFLKEYPELAKYPISDRTCAVHFQVLLASALAKAQPKPLHEPEF